MRPPAPSTARRGLLALALVAACAPSPGGARDERSVLRSVPGAGNTTSSVPPAPERLLDRLDPVRLAALEVLGGRLVEATDRATVESARVARLPGLARGALGSVSTLVLEARSPRAVEVTLLLHPGPDRPGQRQMVDRRSLEAGERTRLAFELPIARDPEGSLELAFHSPAGEAVRVDLLQLELRARPAAAFLPPPASPPSPITLGLETRPAVTLSAGTPRTLARLPGRTSRLGAGVPVVLPGEDPGTLVVRQGARRLAERALDVPGVWFDLDVAPDEEDERPLEVLLEGPAGAACALAIPLALERRAEPRTVVLVTTDTHRADHVGAAHAAAVRTPAIDALALRGIFFEDAGSVSNMTGPSHVTILTGVHPRDTGVVDNASRLTDEAPTLAEAFAEAGFFTLGATSASHLGPETGFTQGFDRFLAPGLEGTGAIDALAWTRAALGRVDGLDVFVWVHLFDPHAPYEPPAAAIEEYWPGDRDPRAADLSPPRELRIPNWAVGVRDGEYLAALYRAEVTAMDERLGGFLDLPRVREGIVALTADHGETLGLGPEAWDHGQLGPDTQRVPLVLAAPDLARERGLRVRAPVGNADLGRTLLDLAGLVHAPFPGRNLVDLARDDDPLRVPRFGLASHGSSATIELDGWYLRLQLVDPAELAGGGPPTIHHGRGKQRHQVELFHLPTDPEGRRDLVDAEPERAARLRALLVAFLREARPSGWNAGLEPDAARSELLESLGYAGTSRATSDNRWWDGECTCAWCARF